ncbi:MAG: imidazoleglycerol-phosphate dehydratase HisB [Firmicutes bacterium]|nr:imidazoleglycerol-phosphate dehydratase HisB [Bacillota bacterium]
MIERIERNAARCSTVERVTGETNIKLTLCLDGNGEAQIETGVPFLNHMLTLFAGHGGFNLALNAVGDIAVDDHHTVEDVGICLGQALREALGDKGGIRRYGQMILPMDEALVLVAMDISGRSYLSFDVPMPRAKTGSFDTELVEEFIRALAVQAGLTLHVKLLAGANTHHIIEAVFKGLARALRSAAEIIDPSRAVPSTKGVL